MRILLAEDESHMANVLKKALCQKSLAVDVVSNGEEALHLASVSDYDVLLLDVMMPKMKGHDVCHMLRSKGIRTPIIMLSGKGSVPDKILGLDSGADDYLPKPFSFSELMARIRALQRRRTSFTHPEIRIKNLRMNRNTRVVKRAGETLNLSPKEYRLLEYFMLNKGKVLSRFDILENVWGGDDGSYSNVVDVHLSHLRKKVDTGEFQPLFKTVRGQGYILE